MRIKSEAEHSLYCDIFVAHDFGQQRTYSCLSIVQRRDGHFIGAGVAKNSGRLNRCVFDPNITVHGESNFLVFVGHSWPNK